MRKIRKTQQNLVEKAEKQGFAEQNIEYLRIRAGILGYLYPSSSHDVLK